MLKRALAIVMAASFLAGTAWAADFDLATQGDLVPDTIGDNTYLWTSTPAPVSQPDKQITIDNTFVLTIGPNQAAPNNGVKLDYTLKSITSGGADAGLTIAQAFNNLGTTVRLETLDFNKGGTVIIANGGVGEENRLMVNTFSANVDGKDSQVQVGSNAIFQIGKSATFNGDATYKATLRATAVDNFVALDANAQLILNGGRLNGVTATLNIGNSAGSTGTGQVVFKGANSQISGTVDAKTVDTVVDGSFAFAKDATYTTRNYTHASGNATGTNNTTLHVLGDAEISGGMVRPGTMRVDGTFTIKTNGTGHADRLIVNKMAPVQSGGVDMILTHTITTGGYTIEADAFVKGCRMVPGNSTITFGQDNQTFLVKQHGIMSTLENNIVMNGVGIKLDLGGYYFSDHNVGTQFAQVGFNQSTGMHSVQIRDTAALVLGERQQIHYHNGSNVFPAATGDIIMQTVANGGNAGTITGMFNNVKQLAANSWGYYSYFGDYGLTIGKVGGNDALIMDSYARSDFRDYDANRAQLAKMGLNPKASFGVLQNLQQLAVDITSYLASYPVTYEGKAPEYGHSYDAGNYGNYHIGVMGVDGANDTETYTNVAGRLNRDMYSSVVNGSRIFQTNRKLADKDPYIGFINGFVDAAAWEYMNAATVNNVVRANQRAMLTASDMVYDRLAGYGFGMQNLYSAVGSDAGMAAAILNANYLNRFWVTGMGQWDDADNRGGFAGYEYESYGFATGYDRAIGAFIVGGSFAYTTGDYEDNYAAGHDSDIDNYAFNLYATYNHCSGFFGTIVGGYTYSDNDIKELRGGNWAEQDFETDTWYVSGKLGYNWRPLGGLTLTPSVGIGYVSSRADSHDGVYAGIHNQRFSRMKADTGFVPVELRANYDWCLGAETTFGLNAKVGYTYNFDEDAATGDAFLYGIGNASPIRAVGRDFGHHALNLGAGVKFTHRRFDFGVNYDYVGMSDFDSHRVNATIGIGF